MRVTTVTAQVKYSQDTGHDAWKSIELGAEASVDGKETWTEAQASLYQQLGCQLKALWANGTGHKAQDGSENHGEAIATAEPTQTPPEHFCQVHDKHFKQYHRGESVWWSHKMADGKWCRAK